MLHRLTKPSCLPTDGNITYRRLGQELKGEVESVANMWLHTAIPRPASPPLHHLSARIIEQHIMCSHCAVLSCSSHCYHKRGQRFHSNVWRTRKYLDALLRRSCSAQAELNPDGTLIYTWNTAACLFSIFIPSLKEKVILLLISWC